MYDAATRTTYAHLFKTAEAVLGEKLAPKLAGVISKRASLVAALRDHNGEKK